jgi:fucose permease
VGLEKPPPFKYYRGITFTCYLGMLTCGILTGAIGPLLISITRFYRLDIARAGLPVVFDASGYLAGTLLVSFIWKVHRARLLLFFSSLISLAILAGIIAAHSYFSIFLGLIFLLGFSSGFLNVGIDSLFSEIFGVHRARFLNISHIFFGLGAFSGPLLVVMSLNLTGKWYFFYVVIALIFLPLTVLYFQKRIYAFSIDLPMRVQTGREAGVRAFAYSLPFWMILAVMFFTLGIELAYTAWGPLYFTQIRNLSSNLASYSVSTFWLALLAGRWIFMRFFFKIDLTQSLIAASIASAVFIALSFVSETEAIVLIFATCTGLVFSIIYPNTLALGAGFYPAGVGFITGAVSASGGAGCIFFPWLMGPVSQTIGLSKSVFLIPLLGLCQAGILGFLYYWQRRNPSGKSDNLKAVEKVATEKI